MTVDAPAGDRGPEVPGGSPVAAADPVFTTPPLSPPVLLEICDRLLGEVGRRTHRFAWLRLPRTGLEGCLPVDGYYPANRLIVVLRRGDLPTDPLYTQEAAKHGLHALIVDPALFGGDPRDAEDELVSLISSLGPLPARIREPEPPAAPAAPPSRPTGSGQLDAAFKGLGGRLAPEPRVAPALKRKTTAARGSGRPLATSVAPRSRRPQPAAQPPVARHSQTYGVVLGLALSTVLAFEALVLVAIASLGHDHPVLGIGLAFDCCARALGTIAAAREGDLDVAWSCVIFGSPAVVGYTLLAEREGIRTEPAPLAGAMGLLAIALVGIAVAGAVLGV
jgi:hypothetical protein